MTKNNKANTLFRLQNFIEVLQSGANRTITKRKLIYSHCVQTISIRIDNAYQIERRKNA